MSPSRGCYPDMTTPRSPTLLRRRAVALRRMAARAHGPEAMLLFCEEAAALETEADLLDRGGDKPSHEETIAPLAMF
jgi:hypothetical protein